MKNLQYIFIACLLIFGSNIYCQNTWIPFTSPTPQTADVSLIESDNVSVEFSIEVFGMYQTDILESGIDFQRISTPGGSGTVVVGQPEMPVIRQLIAIPHCTDVTLSVNVTATTSFTNFNIYPAPELVEVTHPDSSVSVEESFVYDQAAYQQNQNYPQVTAEIASTGYLRDQMYAEVFIYPILFNPVTGNLQVNTNYELTLTFTNPSGPVNENTGIFNNVASNVFLNYVSSGITAEINDRPGHTGDIEWIELTQQSQAGDIVADYLIITDDMFWDPSGQTTDLLKIAQHRAEYNGFDIAIVKVEQVIDKFKIPGEDFEWERSIRRFIKAVYDDGSANNTYDGKLGYVLLVGKPYYDLPDGIPASYDQNPGAIFQNGYPNSAYPSDYYYACLTSDNGLYDDVGELFIGRFCVDNDEELSNIIEKTVYHEREFDPEVHENNNTVFFMNSSFQNPTQYLGSYHPWLETIINPPYDIKIFNVLVHAWDSCFYDIVDTLNAGVKAMFYYGHSDINHYTISQNGMAPWLSTEFLTENLSNKGKYPFVANHSCKSGQYDLHYGQCLAEELTTYSDTCGYLACLASGRLFWLDKGNLPNFPAAIQEVMPISIWQHQSHILGEFVLESKVASPAKKDNFALNLFGDPALNLMAEGFEITNNATLLCGTEISSEIYVRSGATLTIPACSLNFLDHGALIIDNDAKLKIFEGAVISGINEQNAIYVYGSIEFISNEGNHHPIELTAPGNHTWRGLAISNYTADIDMFSPLIFKNCGITCNSNSLNIIPPNGYNNTFGNSSFQLSHGSLVLNNTDFTNSSILVLSPDNQESSVEISFCEFNNESNVFLSSIFIEQYRQYNIHDNVIKFSDGDGITIFNCGGVSEYNFPNGIANNLIEYTGTSPALHKGIKVYRGKADIFTNKIINADYGIVGMNNSLITIIGDVWAQAPDETQQIVNNESYQLHFTNNSFPQEISYNIIGNGNDPDPLVYNDANPPVGTLFDITLNCWDNHFSASNDLIPVNQYNWIPIWCPPTTKSFSGNNAIGDDVLLYTSAIQNIENGNFATAQSEFKEIISDYPDTETAKNAVKQLFDLEPILNNDYQALIDYLDNEPNLQNNNQLGKLSDWMISYCNIELGEFQLAIDWYDNLIDTTSSEADSTFAAIDMGEAALAMGNATKGSVQCKHTQFVFDNHKDFEINREYLINELLKSQSENQQTPSVLDKDESRIAVLHQNVPNPVTSTSTIVFELNEQAIVDLDIFDITGRNVLSLANDLLKEGTYTYEIDTKSMNQGMYMISLKLNGLLYDSKKMIVR